MFLLITVLACPYGSTVLAHGKNSDSKPEFCKTDKSISNPHCGSTPTAIFDKDGLLHIVYVDGQWIKYTTSNDLGKSFSPYVKVTPEPEKIYADGENRPKIALGAEGQIYVSWVNKTEGRYTGDVRFSRSIDNGSSFSKPIIVNDDGLLTSHRFETLVTDTNGNVYITWLDKRDLFLAKKAGNKYNGAALYYAVSKNDGLSFSINKKIADHSCECCRISVEQDQQGNVLALWRHIFDKNIRDHAISKLDTELKSSDIERVTFDDWQIDACPHHGPDMAIDNDNSLHMTWFTGKAEKAGLFYGRYNQAEKKLEHTYHLSDLSTASRPQIHSYNEQLILVWKEFKDDKTYLQLKTSSDSGQTWSKSNSIATTAAESDHPLLLQNQNQLYVSWWTSNHGLQLIPIANDKEIVLKSFTGKSLNEIEQSYKGSDFILSFWSLDCPPCFKELELFSKLYKKNTLPKLVLVSTDGHDSLSEIKSTLTKFGIEKVDNWYFDDLPERLRMKIDSTWFGELPRSYFYNKDGERKAHSGVLTLNHLNQWLTSNL